ncbi:MAG: hypothetical protein M0R46_14640 [Candidatus Muirbacterium halophilum]|nr:hypothetical protein [Candidatus Muirbacterium halophilum]
MFKRINFYVIFLIFLSVEVSGYVYGIQKITFPIEQKKLINEKDISLFFNVNEKNDTFEIYIDFDNSYYEDNGINNIGLKKDKFFFGFVNDNSNNFFQNNKKTGLTYSNSNIKLTTGWNRGIRNQETFILPSGSKTIFLSKTNIIDESESVFVNNTLLKRNFDYTIDNSSGIVSFYVFYPEKSIVTINYSYYSKINGEKDIRQIYPDIDYNTKNIKITSREEFNSAKFNIGKISFDNFFVNSEYFNNISLKHSFSKFTVKTNYIDEQKAIKNSKYIGLIPDYTINSNKFSYRKFNSFSDFKYNFSNYSYLDIFKKNNEDSIKTLKITEKFNDIYCDSNITMNKYSLRNQDLLLSFRKNNLFFSSTDLMINGKFIDREKKLIYFKNRQNFSLKYKNSDIYKGISSNFDNFYLNLEWKDISDIYLLLSTSIDNWTFSYIDEIQNTGRISFKKDGFNTNLDITDSKLANSITNITLKNTKITFDYKKLIEKRIIIRFYTAEDFLEFDYSEISKKGTFSYNTIIN